MDLSGWSLKELRQWCRDHYRYAGGSREEVEQRISDAVCADARVSVYFPARDSWREGTVVKILKQDKFRVLYDDNAKETVHSLLETNVLLIEDQFDDADRLDLIRRSLSSWSKKELQAYCVEHNLPAQGTKADLLELVAMHCAAASDYDDEVTSEEEDVQEVTAGMHNLSTGYGSGPMYSMHRPGGPRKRALIVGCSYKGMNGYLAGTLQDAQDIRSLLVQHFWFPEDSIMELTDGQQDRFRLPTRHNILKGFEWLMHDVQPGDSLFFYFSGHGGEEQDLTGEEPSGYNQTICPVDYHSAGQIKDSLIHHMLVQPLPMGVTLHALIDSCHSGTVMNLPYNAVLRKGQFEDWHEEYKGRSRSWQKMTAGGLAVQFSAARHDQLAMETSRKNKGKSYSCGAATYAFVQAILRHRGVWGFDIVYGELLLAMFDELQKSAFRKQEPTLSSSLQFDCMSSRTKLKL